VNAGVITFVTSVIAGLTRRGPPLQSTWNVLPDGQVTVQVRGASGRESAFSKVFEIVYKKQAIPAIEAYIRTGVIPPGTHPDVVAFINRTPDFAAARNVLFPPEEPGGDVGSESEDLVGRVFGGPHMSPIGPEDYFVPRFVRSIPGGAAGFAQQTPAGQRQMFGNSMGRRPVKRSGPKRLKVAPRARRKPVKSSRKPRPGTKAWMTYIRGLRKKG